MSIPSHHASYTNNPSRMPHPEVHMDYVCNLCFSFAFWLIVPEQIAEGLGPRAWKYQV